MDNKTILTHLINEYNGEKNNLLKLLRDTDGAYYSETIDEVGILNEILSNLLQAKSWIAKLKGASATVKKCSKKR